MGEPKRCEDEWEDERIDEEVRQGRLLVILDNDVYDCSKFASIHPGGRNHIEEYAGRQVRDVMVAGPHEHSFNAYQLMKDYCCGTLANTKDSRHLKQKCDVFGETSSKVNGGHDNQNTNSCESLVDWSKPILWQVGHLGSHYSRWVHTPVDKPLRLFESDFVEFFSKTPWFVIPVIWIPVILIASFNSIVALNDSTPHSSDYQVLGMFLSLFIFGIVLWTFLEYLVHRFLFHLEPSPKYPIAITFHFLLHGQHHKVPFDPGRLVFPPAVASLIAVCYYTCVSCLLTADRAQAVFAGTVLGYVCYDLIHYYLHYGKPSTPYFKMLKAYHVKHHFEDQNRGFGISSPVWDLPFGTQLDLSKKD